jgi:D-alanine--D-alanine ligase
MRITVVYNLRPDDSESSAELIREEDINRVRDALLELNHKVAIVEASGKPSEAIDKILYSEPDLIFNLAEGTVGSSREAFYPGLYEQMGIPFIGGNSSLLHVNMDKQLAKTVLSARGVRVPKGVLVTPGSKAGVDGLTYPLIVKPNSEGSSKGIFKDSVVENPAECKARVAKLLEQYPAGVVVEEFISGREINVPILEAFPAKLLSPVEHIIESKALGRKYNIFDYELKQMPNDSPYLRVECPPKFTAGEKKAVMDMARQVLAIMNCPDFGRVDFRLREDGVPFFIELNPLPSLHHAASTMTAAKVKGLEYKDVIRLIVKSAAKRNNLAAKPAQPLAGANLHKQRATVRELGIQIGRFDTGVYNAITVVKGVKVGHVTHIHDDVAIPASKETGIVRTGVTAILPSGKVFHNKLPAGGFVLNGIGDVAGLHQLLEWGWLETPILLTSTMSVGKVHGGIVSYMQDKHVSINRDDYVILPVVGETDDSFLNDMRVNMVAPKDAARAIENAKGGRVPQGSVGGGTGMMSFDFAGGIGTSSRVFGIGERTYTVGVLVQSNLGRMRNLTVDGAVVGKDLDSIFPYESRRVNSYGSIIVVVATDAPLLSSQLNRLAKRAALGLGRVGSHAASTSGEIVLAFSTANPLSTVGDSDDGRYLKLRFLSDTSISTAYEAVIDATEEAVLNAIFVSAGMDGKNGRQAPAVPHDKVVKILNKGRGINEGNRA